MRLCATQNIVACPTTAWNQCQTLQSHPVITPFVRDTLGWHELLINDCYKLAHINYDSYRCKLPPPACVAMRCRRNGLAGMAARRT